MNFLIVDICFVYLCKLILIMTTSAIRKKVIEYVNHAEPNIVEAVYKIIQVMEGDSNASIMTVSQKKEAERISKGVKEGKIKTLTWSEVKKTVRSSRIK